MLFLTDVGHGYCEKRQKQTRRYLPDTAVSLKKGDFNTPPYSHFLKGKRRLEICYFKTAVRLLYFVLAHEYPAAETTVFLLSRWADKITLLTKKEPTTTLINGLSALRLCVRLCDNENFKLYCIDQTFLLAFWAKQRKIPQFSITSYPITSFTTTDGTYNPFFFHYSVPKI